MIGICLTFFFWMFLFQIHTVVSGALDRLHYEKDPCVKYDVNRKLWIYLHRHRTEEEFGNFSILSCLSFYSF